MKPNDSAAFSFENLGYLKNKGSMRRVHVFGGMSGDSAANQNAREIFIWEFPAISDGGNRGESKGLKRLSKIANRNSEEINQCLLGQPTGIDGKTRPYRCACPKLLL